MFNVGDYVINIAVKNWGTGKITEIRGGKAEVLFSNAGSKTLSLKHAKLELSDKKSFKKPNSQPAKNELTYSDFRKNVFKKNNERYLDQYKIVAGFNIQLLSKKSTYSVMSHKCDKCKKMVASWVFAKSNVGRLYVCNKCKPLLVDKSFGRLDALDFAERGGSFEGSRRKH